MSTVEGMIVNMEENVKIEMAHLLVTAKEQDIRETIVMLMSMNAKLWVHAKTMVPVKMLKVLLPVIAKTLRIKDPIATNLNTVSRVFPDFYF